MLRDVVGFGEWDNIDLNNEFPRFRDLKNDAWIALYNENTKHTKLSFVSKLLHFKSSQSCS